MAGALQNFLFSLKVCLNHLHVIEREGERIEHLGGPELWIALQNALHAGSPGVKGPQAPNRHARTEHVRTAAQHVLVHADVRMRNENDR